MEKNETKLTAEVYESIIDTLVRDVVKLKREQGETISKIAVEKETLNSLKTELKKLKKAIKSSKTNLRRINDTLNTRNHSITELNYAITSEEERTIDLNEYSIEQPKRR